MTADASVPFGFTSCNIYYITPITRHCHANILPSTGQENNIVRPKKISYFASHLLFNRFSPFNCCLSVVL